MPLTQQQKDWVVTQSGYSPSTHQLDDDGYISEKTTTQPAVLSNGLPQPKLTPAGPAPMGMGSTFVKEAIHAAPATAMGGLGAWGGAALGAPLAPVTAGLSIPIGAILGGFGLGMGTSLIQDKIEEAVVPDYVAQRQANLAANPVTGMAARLSTMPLGGMNFSPSNLGRAGGDALSRVTGATSRLNPAQTANLANVGIGAGLGTGIGVGTQLAQGRPLGETLTSLDTLEALIGGAAFNKPNAIGKRYGWHDVPASAPRITDDPRIAAIQAELARTKQAAGKATPTPEQQAMIDLAGRGLYEKKEGKAASLDRTDILTANQAAEQRGINPTKAAAMEAQRVREAGLLTPEDIYQQKVRKELERAASARRKADFEKATLELQQQAAQAQAETAQAQALKQELKQRQQLQMKLGVQATPEAILGRGITMAPENRPATPRGNNKRIAAMEADPVDPFQDAADDIQTRLERKNQPEGEAVAEDSELRQAVVASKANTPLDDFAKTLFDARAQEMGANVGKTTEKGSFALLADKLKRMAASIGTAEGADTRAHEVIGHIYNKMLELSPYESDKRIQRQMLKAAAESPELKAINERRAAAGKEAWAPDEFVANQQGLEWLMRNAAGETPNKAWFEQWKAGMKSVMGKANAADLRRLVDYKWHNDAPFAEYFGIKAAGDAAAKAGARVNQDYQEGMPELKDTMDSQSTKLSDANFNVLRISQDLNALLKAKDIPTNARLLRELASSLHEDQTQVLLKNLLGDLDVSNLVQKHAKGLELIRVDNQRKRLIREAAFDGPRRVNQPEGESLQPSKYREMTDEEFNRHEYLKKAMTADQEVWDKKLKEYVPNKNYVEVTKEMEREFSELEDKAWRAKLVVKAQNDGPNSRAAEELANLQRSERRNQPADESLPFDEGFNSKEGDDIFSNNEDIEVNDALPVKMTPPPEGYRRVKIVSKDGATREVFFNDKFYPGTGELYGQQEDLASFATMGPNGLSHGVTRPGDKIVEMPDQLYRRDQPADEALRADKHWNNVVEDGWADSIPWNSKEEMQADVAKLKKVFEDSNSNTLYYDEIGLSKKQLAFLRSGGLIDAQLSSPPYQVTPLFEYIKRVNQPADEALPSTFEGWNKYLKWTSKVTDPTPDSLQYLMKYDGIKSRTEQMQDNYNAVLSGRKPIAAFYREPQNVPEGLEVRRISNANAEAHVGSFAVIKKGNINAFNELMRAVASRDSDAVGKALGYSEQETAEFKDRSSKMAVARTRQEINDRMSGRIRRDQPADEALPAGRKRTKEEHVAQQIERNRIARAQNAALRHQAGDVLPPEQVATNMKGDLGEMLNKTGRPVSESSVPVRESGGSKRNIISLNKETDDGGQLGDSIADKNAVIPGEDIGDTALQDLPGAGKDAPKPAKETLEERIARKADEQLARLAAATPLNEAEQVVPKHVASSEVVHAAELDQNYADMYDITKMGLKDLADKREDLVAEHGEDSDQVANIDTRIEKQQKMLEWISKQDPTARVDLKGIKKVYQPEGEALAARERQINSPEFKRWFGDSKVVDAETGKPKVLLHLSKAGGFSKFKDNMHFGTEDQAMDIFNARNDPEYTQGENPVYNLATYPVYLSIKNPKSVRDMIHAEAWNKAIELAKAEGHDGLVYRNDAEGLATFFPPRENVDSIKPGQWAIERRFNDFILVKDKQAGEKMFDNTIGAKAVRQLTDVDIRRFKAKNQAGKNLSYVAFYPEQIKSATGNSGAFDPKNPDIRYQPEGEALAARERQINSPEFKRWFGASKVVDPKTGKPVVLYHGAREDFNAYDSSKLQNGKFGVGAYLTDDPAVASKYGDMTMPLYAKLEKPFRATLDSYTSTEDFKSVLQQTWNRLEPLLPKTADKSMLKLREQFAEQIINDPNNYRGKAGPNTTSRRALYHAFEFFDKNWPQLFGHDGMIIDVNPEHAYGATKEYLVYNPTQIKSATGNSGAFDAANPDIRYQPAEEALPSTIYERTGAVGKGLLHTIGAEVDKLKSISPAAGKAAEAFLTALRARRGELEGSFNYALRQVRKAQNVKEYWFQDNADYQKVVQWRDAMQDGDAEPFALTATQKAINDVVDANLKRSLDLRESFKKEGDIDGLARGTAGKKFYLPHVMARDVATTLAETPTSAKAAKLLEDFISYRQEKSGQTAEEAKKDWNTIRNSFNMVEEGNIASRFGAIDKALGKGLPKSMREQNLMDRMGRFNRRFARRVAFHEAIQRNTEARDAFFGEKGVASTTVGKNILRDMFGIREHTEATRSAASGIVRALMLGPLTGAKDVISGQVLGLQHMGLEQVLPAKMEAFAKFGENYKKAIETGVVRNGYGGLESGEGGLGNVQAILQRSRDVINQVQGRQMLETVSRVMNYGEGRFLAADAFRAIENGRLSAQQRGFLDDFVPNWQELKNKPIDGKVLDEAAARFVESVQGTYDYRGLPSVAMQGTFSPYLSLARWNIEKFNNFTKKVVDPATKGNYQPLLMATLGAFIGGAAVNALVEEVTGRKERTAKWDEIAASKEQTGLIGYKLAALASMSGYGGILGDIVKSGFDAKYKNRVQTFSNPLIDAGATVLEDTKFLVQAMEEGDLPAVTDVLNLLATDYIQAWRIALPHVSGEKKKELEATNKRRDLKVWKMGEGEELSAASNMRPNPLVGKAARQFKQTDDMQEAAGLVPELVDKAIAKATTDGSINPEILKEELSKYKRNSYQTVPNPQQSPISATRYIDFLSKTQGRDEASRRIEDYMRRNAINQAKSKMIPTIQL